jgi:hypothetical protein
MAKARIYVIFATLAATLTCLAPAVQAANWHLDAAVASSGNGQSWATAWKNSSNVAWGASGVNAGDTLYVATGSYSPLTVGASGSAGNPITIRASQDTHTGVATFSGGDANSPLVIGGASYITVNGNFGGARNLAFSHAAHDQATAAATIVRGNGSNAGITVTYCSIDNGGIGLDFPYPNGVEISYSAITNIYGDRAIGFGGAPGTLTWGFNKVHHNTIALLRGSNGLGPDGISGIGGVDVYNNNFSSTAGTIYGAQHQDFLQIQGSYWRIYNNDFLNSSDSAIDYGYPYTGPTGIQHFRIYNNTFRDYHFHLWRFHDQAGTFDPAVTNSLIKNNLFYNCGITNPIDNWEDSTRATAADYNFDYNLIGGAYTQFKVDSASPYTQANPRTGTPQFVSYSPKSVSNDLHLAAGDTAARGAGVDLSAYFTTDKDGNTRSGAWSIGAFQSNSGQSALPMTPGPLTVQ